MLPNQRRQGVVAGWISASPQSVAYDDFNRQGRSCQFGALRPLRRMPATTRVWRNPYYGDRRRGLRLFRNLNDPIPYRKSLKPIQKIAPFPDRYFSGLALAGSPPYVGRRKPPRPQCRFPANRLLSTFFRRVSLFTTTFSEAVLMPDDLNDEASGA